MPRGRVQAVAAIVIGAGPAGLATSQQLGARGIRHVVLERGDAVGHTWANLYDSLTLHTGKHLSSLPGLRFPRAYPLFVPRLLFCDYLRRYAETFRLPVETGSAVTAVQRDDGVWRVSTARGDHTARAVVIATGIVANPQRPRFRGAESFRGRLTHSVEYRNPAPYVGRRVLVVGVGNSGAEIGSEIARAGGGGVVTIAVRSGANVVPRTVFGLPIQYLAYWVRKLPRPAQEAIVAGVRKLTELRRGPSVLPRPRHSPLDAIPVIGFHLVDAIRAGLIRVKPGLAEFTPEGARFADDSVEPFDDVILATGFAPALGPLGTAVRTDAKGFALRTARVTSVDQPNLYFVGHNYDATGGLYNIRVDSRLVARRIAQAG
ncbi:MAG: NAD(P)/FAD-dependent oxidoreductase [Gemmatimonadetes bacterium]|nr:MAG: NAD(P)/FAD-dependent oxidoreductase [Gemmatimonadota bacterium]PYP63151.1 MAG: NAD(P)/FAD-dependent oxidoreductase [Gemmatimonadota bacterium]